MPNNRGWVDYIPHFSSIKTDVTLPFRCTQVKKKGPLQTPKPLIFFLFPISENVDGIMARATFLLNSDLNSSSGTLWDPLPNPDICQGNFARQPLSRRRRYAF